ncbi:MAG: LysR family transcriptional regulator [Acidimicrobiales bacterium]|nr:LysR family transcriptional regulator [Acidimicrobiales bacterium]
MNLQQLRYIVATADEGTMTRAAETIHVAQPALSRAIRSFEREIGVTVFERKGRGVRITREGADVIAGARRILSEVERLSSIGTSHALRVCSVSSQAREVASPTVARFVTAGHGRAAVEVADTSGEVADHVRDGRAHLGIMELPAPADLWVTSLGWQELVLLHPAGWSLDDPLAIAELSNLPLLSPGTDDWRTAALDNNLRLMGVEATIAAETTDDDLIAALVVEGAGAWFSYGRHAAAAVAGGAGLVHLTPPAVREIGIVALEPPRDTAQQFVDLARAETATTLLPVGDPILETAMWISGADVLGSAPPPTSVPPPARPPA